MVGVGSEKNCRASIHKCFSSVASVDMKATWAKALLWLFFHLGW